MPRIVQPEKGLPTHLTMEDLINATWTVPMLSVELESRESAAKNSKILKLYMLSSFGKNKKSRMLSD